MEKHPETLEESARYVRLALPLMTRHGVPVTPANYAVWYRYVSGRDTDLSRRIDQMIRNTEIFSPEANIDLYQKHCIAAEEKNLEKIREDLKAIMGEVFEHVSEAEGGAARYGTALARTVGNLSADHTVEEIRDFLDDVIEETKLARESTLSLEERLKSTTRELESLREAYEQAKSEAATDFLTGLANRKTFQAALDRLTADAADTGEPLALLLIDIDHFKRINDRYGHIVGDEMLRFAARQIQETVKGRDLVARYGGEEFVVILPGTQLVGAEAASENIRAGFARREVRLRSNGEVRETLTVSIGVSSYRTGELLQTFIDRSDQALYLAKRTGRNRVVTETLLTKAAAIPA